MKRKRHIKAFTLAHEETNKRIAFHAAGHATAIYVGNQQKGLTPTLFHIFIKSLNGDWHSDKTNKTISTKIEGGYFISNFPPSLEEAKKGLSKIQKHAYDHAFEADIINLLSGFLAEANYVALRDDEPISPRLVNLSALPNYGGLSDLKKINQYFECIVDSEGKKEKKIFDLYMEAFKFINDRPNWLAITTLAGYILKVDKNVIEFDEIVTVLEDSRKNSGLVTVA